MILVVPFNLTMIDQFDMKRFAGNRESPDLYMEGIRPALLLYRSIRDI